MLHQVGQTDDRDHRDSELVAHLLDRRQRAAGARSWRSRASSTPAGCAPAARMISIGLADRRARGDDIIDDEYPARQAGCRRCVPPSP